MLRPTRSSRSGSRISRHDGAMAFSRRDCLTGLGALAALALVPAGSRAARGGPVSDLRGATALDLTAGLRARQWSARELAQHYLRRIEALNGPMGRFDANGALNAFIRLYPDLARRAWERADKVRAHSGWSGIPVALKDVFAVEGRPVTVGTPAFQSYRAPKDSTLWNRWSAAGAVLLGHTQSQRFISGITTPQTANPWNPKLIVGGSSGGSAAAVAAGLVPVALGTETQGSLIYPALCCGVTTLKPSHGLLSLAGVFPGAPSFDVGGPIARSAADCAWVMATLAGIDPEDAATAEQAGQSLQWPQFSALATAAVPATAGERSLSGVRFLVSTNERYADGSGSATANSPSFVDVEPRIRQGFESFLRSLEALGAEIVSVEISTELGRYGAFRQPDARLGDRSARRLLGVADTTTASLPAAYRWLEQASESEWATAVQWYEGSGRNLESEELKADRAWVTAQTLHKARLVQEALRARWEGLLEKHRCDAHIYLEVGSPIPQRRGLEDTPMPRARRTGVIATDLGWPVLSLPVSAVEGLEIPVSAQLMARRWHDHRLLAWGMAWQQRHPEFVRRVPPEPRFT